ncbi:hypothetical protein GB931_08490 [Modestobacter sp. I12A-02628]|uniref:GH26 domain-containing protein n=1 Tax=Goekera deserti TaxID=2497753 RepID=A0A7K3WEU4_9ACTN|nr:glycosyl hydrolase [Goekera deserti]MPQ97960.1 hypothetical protein [Goekera deserti]NDI48606.1 hypothetical protein [Goekera deserti]NEL55015.1 hypothetical protein [Goekera deserti]
MSVPPETDTPVGGSTALDESGPRHSAPAAARRGPSARLWALLAALLVVVVVVALVVTQGEDGDGPATGEGPGGGNATWLSGVSGPGSITGEIGQWRGRPVEVSSTWVDNNDAMVRLTQLQPGGELDGYDAPLDVAVGAIGDGETWAGAAAGDYDDRWRESLTNLKGIWGDRTATMYIRFAHEMNGNWYDWKVTEDDAEDFRAAWIRYRALQQEVFPESQLVFSVNRESVDTGIDWRETFPGAEYVDVLGVDYYNNFPYVADADDWASSLDDVDEFGGPKGLDQHLAFAKSVGKPLVVSEWSGNADAGDSPAFIQGMYDFFSKHGGTGPGQLLYEVQYNVGNDDGRWLLYGDTRMPESAALYRELF